MTMLYDKAILITGAASGIGLAAAKLFAEQGALLALCDRNEPGLLSIEQSLRENGAQLFSIPCDVTEEDQVTRVIDAALSKFGRLDGAFNNAGIEGGSGRFTPIIDYRRNDYEQLMNINLTGVWNCLKVELKAMSAAGKGAIVNTASTASLVGMPGMAAYSATKHAVLGLTRSAALEVAAAGIRVNAVAPGITATPMILERGLVMNPGLAENATAMIPMHRFGRPEDIANAAAFLLSDKASYITGQLLAVDGGLTVA